MVQFSRESGVPVFYAETGDTHLKSPVMTPSEERQFRLKATLFRQVHEQLGLDVHGVGELDLGLGWPFLEEVYAGSSIALLCGNLREKATGRFPFPASKVIERGGLKVAFVGVIGEGITLRNDLREQLEILPPDPIVRKAVTEHRDQVDLIVLVSHLGQTEEVRIAREIPGIDVVLGGHSGDELIAPVMSEGVPIVQAGRRGQKVGRLDLWYRPGTTAGAELLPDSPPAPGAKLPRLQYKNRIEMLRAQVLMADQAVEEMVQQYKDKVAALPPMEDDLEIDGEGDGHGHGPGDGHGHGPDDGHGHGAAGPGDPPPPAADAYWGPEVCSACHVKQTEFWQGTTHAKAFSTLVKVGQEKNADCIGCHTLGYKDPAGFEEPAKVLEHLKNVSCEQCHGRGSQHGRKGVFNVGPRAEKTCTVCHTPENDTTWNLAKIDKVACPLIDRSGGD